VAVTQAQLDEIVAQANVQIKIDGATLPFTTFAELKEFFDGEANFWVGHGKGLPHISGFFSPIRSFLQQAANHVDTNAAKTDIRQAVGKAEQRDPAKVYSETPLGRFLASLESQSPEKAAGAYAYHSGQLMNPPATRDRSHFDGVLAAFAFYNPDVFGSLFALHIATCQDEIAKIRVRRKEIDDTSKSLSEGSEKLQAETRRSLEQLLEQGKQALQSTNNHWTDTLQSTHAALKDSIEALVNLYKEKLRLSEPAKYWSQLEADYIKKGRCWTVASVGLVAVLFALVAVIIYYPPAFLNAAVVSLSTIKGTLLLAVAVSTLVYLIHTFVRLALSSHHLARDARERHQLTHIFLSLIQEKAISTEDRNIVLTALFSRADTGLLKHEGGPSMPNPIGALLDGITKR
jgi:hypothetical protein